MLVSQVGRGERVGGPDDRLGGEVEDGVDLVLAERAVHERASAMSPATTFDALLDARQDERRARLDVAAQDGDLDAARRAAPATSQVPSEARRRR